MGKTAIAEGLAKRIVDKQVPEVLSGATVYSLGRVQSGYLCFQITTWGLFVPH